MPKNTDHDILPPAYEDIDHLTSEDLLNAAAQLQKIFQLEECNKNFMALRHECFNELRGIYIHTQNRKKYHHHSDAMPHTGADHVLVASKQVLSSSLPEQILKTMQHLCDQVPGNKNIEQLFDSLKVKLQDLSTL